MPKSRRENPEDQREHTRYALNAPYTSVAVRREGDADYVHVGHAYDISRGGMRVELDTQLEKGERVDMKVSLPGEQVIQIHASGVMVRLHDEDELGPVRMGLQFDGAIGKADSKDLEDFFASGQSAAA